MNVNNYYFSFTSPPRMYMCNSCKNNVTCIRYIENKKSINGFDMQCDDCWNKIPSL